ncbi:efflux RND transporter permease subunit [Geobacter grbiciae]|uniref:efflux RND transporter permease subunit n=1 Tax=Geobacter grbiciae TaxID=155042 RepID=UPI001C02D898|nr:efflux RND transporter permease subunit [Geobacter grbiciae]MBT1076051.1 efflux RND transporter permease subunit [Geobacter grbiciae]
MTSKKQNVAGRLAEYFVTSKMTALFVLSSILIGLLAVALTPREENPQIIVPAAEVQVALPGASAEEVEKLLVRPLETDIKQITGVDHVYATAVNSGCGLMVQFKVGQDKEKSLVRLHDSVMGRRNLLPPEASMPVIRSVDVDDVPVVTVTLTSEKYDDYALNLTP